MHEWIGDNGETPLVVVDATLEGVQVPEEHIKDGAIVLNVALSATHNLVMDNDGVSFDARFGGVARSVYFPMAALLGIYSRESGQGMQFQREDDAGEAAQSPDKSAPTQSSDNEPDETPPRPSKGPNLRLVK